MIRYSIIVPALNEEKHIEKTLSDITKYKPKDSEVILSDGGSNDRTVAIAKKYVDKVVSGKDTSIAAGRNKGIRNARGEVIIFVDADVELASNIFIEIEKALENENVDAGFCGIYPWDGNWLINMGYAGFDVIARVMRSFKLPIGATTCSFFRKKLFNEVGHFSEKVVLEDVDMFLRLSKHKIQYVMLKDNVLLSARKFKAGNATRMLFRYLGWWIDTVFGRKISNHHEVYVPVR